MIPLPAGDENRLKIFQFSERNAIGMGTRDLREGPEYFSISCRPILPPGSIIQNAFHAPGSRCFCFTVWNRDFPPVRPYAELERVVCKPTYAIAIRERDGRYRIENVNELFDEKEPHV